eukprot:CAMPEP_0176424938 /NCGR_PEP_ID=MMETSP0127-20121128/11120_1 /TAXON_ID=938130 /ORGANISM="Platyophrya macrostoma, Strain WH" /LENGTH=994 /DNA_ID=CAMNT_0017806061 /DNA_START=97 /DNA_END=3081 /DNA_ORIENTATION=+
MLRRFTSQALRHTGTRAVAAAAIDIAAIEKEIASRKVFDHDLIKEGVKQYGDLKFDATYANHFSHYDQADHAYGFMTALARRKSASDFFYSKESATSAFYFSNTSREAQLRVMDRIDRFIEHKKAAGFGVSVRSYTSTRDDVVFYNVSLTPFVNSAPAEGELSVSALGTENFIATRSDTVKARYQELMNRVLVSTTPSYKITTESDGTTIVTLAVSADRTTHLASLSALIYEAPGAKVTKKFLESFANGVHIYTLYVTGCSEKVLEHRVSLNSLLPNRPANAITRLHESLVFNAEEAIFAHCLITFAFYFTPPPVDEDYKAVRTHLGADATGVKRLNNLRATLSQELVSERYMGELIQAYPDIAKHIYTDFLNGSTAESRATLLKEITERFGKDGRTAHQLQIFKTFLKFNASVLKHNFFRVNKAALAFRLDPAVFIKDLDYPRIPHGIFFFVGGQWRGFHVRFTEIARGGVRLILSTPNTYHKNKTTVFQENYNLAHTQLLKNKDIPEGGSKGTILVSSRYLNAANKFDEPRAKQLFLQYVDAMLDVIIPETDGVVDNYGKPEIIFLGPDENTAGSFPSAGALYAKARGYAAWKSFTTGKDPSIGGIPHDTYGMTTRSVRACVEGVYRKLGMDEASLTKFQTGGPDGDLGSNEILRSREKYIALVDAKASLHDPNGVDKQELERLAKARLTLDNFDVRKLSPKGFLVKTTDKDVTLPDGTLVSDGTAFRNTFHLTPYTRADVFVPCGGRPASVTLENVQQLVDVDGATGEQMLAGKFEKLAGTALKHRVIVEGANLFLTQDARLALEKCGVVIIKDATANKGGVTSSSLEVLTGLALSDAEHAELMSAKSEADAPEFYKSLVKEICDRVERNAKREFEAVWRAYEAKPTEPKTLICDALSEKIVTVRTNILHSNIFEDKRFLRYVMASYAPKTLLGVVPVDTMMARVPANYQHAICAMWLASDYVYTYGAHGTEFDFYQFMENHAAEAAKLTA